MSGATIEILYFAQVAEQVGLRHETMPLAEPVQASQWLAELALRRPQLGNIRRLNVAINQEHANDSSLIQPGDEVAVFEPVTGG